MGKIRNLIGATVAAALLGAPFGASAAPFLVKVADSGLSYEPKTAHVTKGRVVKWKNFGSSTHKVIFYKKPKGSGVRSFTLAPDEAKKRKMRKIGRYKYRCTVGNHSSLSDGQCSGMCGVVRAHSG
jgi:plastocyanin